MALHVSTATDAGVDDTAGAIVDAVVGATVDAVVDVTVDGGLFRFCRMLFVSTVEAGSGNNAVFYAVP